MQTFPCLSPGHVKGLSNMRGPRHCHQRLHQILPTVEDQNRHGVAHIDGQFWCVKNSSRQTGVLTEWHRGSEFSPCAKHRAGDAEQAHFITALPLTTCTSASHFPPAGACKHKQSTRNRVWRTRPTHPDREDTVNWALLKWRQRYIKRDDGWWREEGSPDCGAALGW